MSFLDVLDLVPEDFMNEEKVVDLFKLSLKYLNQIGLYRLKADAFAHNGLKDEYYTFETLSEFEQRYLALSLFVVNDLYNESDEATTVGTKIEIALSYLYSLLARYINILEYSDKEIEKLLKENDEFKGE